MFTTRKTIESLAERIERAYTRWRPHWNPGCSAPGVWEAAAANLIEIHRTDPKYPLDPELYVASQAIDTLLIDPWSELTQPASARRFRERVRRIIAALRAELRAEVSRAEARIRREEPLVTVLIAEGRSLSALGRFAVAVRAGHDDLAELFRVEASEQHRTCPLYRQACRTLFPPEAYPVPDAPPEIPAVAARSFSRSRVPLN